MVLLFVFACDTASTKLVYQFGLAYSEYSHAHLLGGHIFRFVANFNAYTSLATLNWHFIVGVMPQSILAVKAGLTLQQVKVSINEPS